MMKKTYLNPIKVLALIAVVIGLVFTTGCSGDDDDDDVVATENIAGVLAADAEFSELLGFINADAELKAFIEGTNEYTLFAPRNAAFDRLRAVLGVESLDAISPAVISRVLKFHFVAGTKLSGSLSSGALTSEEGNTITVGSNGNIDQAGSDTDGSEILSPDLLATNGVVHKVETILIPEPLFITIGTNLGTLAQPVLLGADFTDVAGIIAVADSDPGGETPITTVLADRQNKYTCFIPTNAVLDAILGEAKAATIASLTSTPAVARNFILNHVTSGEINADDLATGTQVTMLSDLSMTVVAVGETSPTGFVLAYDAQNAETYLPIFAADVYQATVPDPNNANATIELESALNGTLHVSAPITGG